MKVHKKLFRELTSSSLGSFPILVLNRMGGCNGRVVCSTTGKASKYVDCIWPMVVPIINTDLTTLAQIDPILTLIFFLLVLLNLLSEFNLK